MVEKNNEDDKREATASVQSGYNDGSKLKNIERFKICLVCTVKRACCWIAYKELEREDQG